jgi:HNH endonuclease
MRSPTEPKLCECGCGAEVRSRFLPGHWVRTRVHPSLAERFSAKTELATDLSPNGWSGCIIWTGATLPAGHGVIRGATLVYAHRVAWELAGRELPRWPRCLDHLCQRPGCVNPEHLEEVAVAVNCRRGTCAKLTQGLADDIRYLRGAGWNAQGIADAYGVSRDTVYGIASGRTWVT